MVPLGEQTIRIVDATPVGSEGGDGRSVVEVPWTTARVEPASGSRTCVEVIEHGEAGDSVVAAPECRTLASARFPFSSETVPESVALGFSGGEEELVAVRQEFFDDRARHSLVLSLVEDRSSGQDVPLGEQTVRISETLPITDDGPDGRPVVSVAWETPLVEANSLVRACARVVRHLQGGDLPVSGPLCNVLHPAF